MNGKQKKVAVSMALVLIGVSLAVALTPASHPSKAAEGIVIDFGEREISYIAVDLSKNPDAMSSLEAACASEGIYLESDGSAVSSIGSRPRAGEPGEWRLFVTGKGETTWSSPGADPSSVKVADYSAVAWALVSDGGVPTAAVDATGVGYHGYPQAKRIISLAPSVTETVVAIGGINAIVGTDLYSDYPESLLAMREKGMIAVVGGYSNPSFELIIKESPDLVLCIASQATHVQMAERLRARGINALVAYDGESIDTVFDNTYMIGEGMGYSLGAARVIGELDAALDMISGALRSAPVGAAPKVMVSLSTAKSPWVAGAYTYMSDILEFASAGNAYGSVNGWSQVNSESVSMYNPDYIIVIGNGGTPDAAGYEEMIAGLPPEWKRTNAYKNGNIYSLEDPAASLASRPSPRVAQVIELVCRILHPGAFEDGIEIPKVLGGNVFEYLTITRDMNFG